MSSEVIFSWLGTNFSAISASTSSVLTWCPPYAGIIPPVVVLTVFLAIIVVRLFKILEPAEAPIIAHSSSGFTHGILSRCPILSERYQPTKLWGRNTHIQVWSFGLLGRPSAPQPLSQVFSAVVSDGATVTFNLFESQERNAYIGVPAEQQPVVVVCPGIAGHCHTPYIQVFVDYFLKNVAHSRVVVLNHLGAVMDQELTAPRIFSYGCTTELSAIVDWTRQRFPQQPLLAVGFSMGGNILLKYLGEKPERQAWFVGAVSCCQGYNANMCSNHLVSGFVPRIYDAVLLFNMMRVVRQHRELLFDTGRQWSPSVASAATSRECSRLSSSCGGSASDSACSVPAPDETMTLQARKMETFDEHFSRRVRHYNSLEDFYAGESCVHVLHKLANVPVLFVNADDDPLIPLEALEYPRQHACSNDRSMSVRTRHGSHLAYFEGGAVVPNTVSWLDRLVVEYSNALLDMWAS